MIQAGTHDGEEHQVITRWSLFIYILTDPLGKVGNVLYVGKYTRIHYSFFKPLSNKLVILPSIKCTILDVYYYYYYSRNKNKIEQPPLPCEGFTLNRTYLMLGVLTWCNLFVFICSFVWIYYYSVMKNDQSFGFPPQVELTPSAHYIISARGLFYLSDFFSEVLQR